MPTTVEKTKIKLVMMMLMIKIKMLITKTESCKKSSMNAVDVIKVMAEFNFKNCNFSYFEQYF